MNLVFYVIAHNTLPLWMNKTRYGARGWVDHIMEARQFFKVSFANAARNVEIYDPASPKSGYNRPTLRAINYTKIQKVTLTVDKIEDV